MSRKTTLVCGVYDALSALIAEKQGFKALYLSGGALSVSLLGKPDIGLLTLDEVLGIAKRITAVVKAPLFVDCDTGFGGGINIQRCVRQMESIGVAGIQIEDQTFPKRCGHLSGKSVVSTDEMVEKIKIAVKARKSKKFLIIARTDARGVMGLAEAQKRAWLYKKAGADILFPEALKTTAEFRQFSAKKGVGPLLANMTEFGISPALSVSELARLGYTWVLFPMTAFRAAAFAMEKALKQLKNDGHSRRLLSRLQKRSDLYRLNKYNDFVKREKRIKI